MVPVLTTYLAERFGLFYEKNPYMSELDPDLEPKPAWTTRGLVAIWQLCKKGVFPQEVFVLLIFNMTANKCHKLLVIYFCLL